MKTFIVFCAVISVVFGHEGWTLKTPADLVAARKACFEEVKLPADKIEEIKKFNYPNEPVVHQYVRCSGMKLGFFDDVNGYHIDHLVEQFGHDKDKVQVRASIEKCIDKNEQKTSAEEWAWRNYKCMIDAGLLTQVKKEVQS